MGNGIVYYTWFSPASGYLKQSYEPGIVPFRLLARERYLHLVRVHIESDGAVGGRPGHECGGELARRGHYDVEDAAVLPNRAIPLLAVQPESVAFEAPGRLVVDEEVSVQ